MRKLNPWNRAAFLLSLFFLTVYAKASVSITDSSNTTIQKEDSTSKSRSVPPESVFHQPYVTTPDMAALARDVSYPINYSTGTPQISIPLYTIQS